MKIKEVIGALEQFAPLPLQADYDNAGLQIGLTEAEVSGALLCLDVTPKIVDEAVAKGCNLIVSHHPLIFHKLNRIADENEVQVTVRKAIGELAADDLVLLLKKRFDVECVQCNQLLRRPIRRVAVCGGAGSFLLDDAIAAGADAFITGEMHYHEYFGHDQEIQIAVIGHYQSEQFTNEIFKSIIEERCAGVSCYLTELNTNPIIYL